jgi:DNA transformation protein
MAKQDPFVIYILEEALGHVSGLQVRPMFGAYGMYKDGVFFAIIEDGELFFKVNEQTVGEYEIRESRQFTYPMKSGETSKMNYWKVPEEILEDRELVEEWIETSVHVAKENKKKKK